MEGSEAGVVRLADSVPASPEDALATGRKDRKRSWRWDAAWKILDRDYLQDFFQAFPRFRFAVITASEKNEARPFQVGQREKPWVIQVCGDDNALLGSSAGKDCRIWGPAQAQLRGMGRIVASPGQPRREHGRKRHVDQEPHRANSTVSF